MDATDRVADFAIFRIADAKPAGAVNEKCAVLFVIAEAPPTAILLRDIRPHILFSHGYRIQTIITIAMAVAKIQNGTNGAKVATQSIRGRW
jgi:hypothetical protein